MNDTPHYDTVKRGAQNTGTPIEVAMECELAFWKKRTEHYRALAEEARSRLSGQKPTPFVTPSAITQYWKAKGWNYVALVDGEIEGRGFCALMVGQNEVVYLATMAPTWEQLLPRVWGPLERVTDDAQIPCL